MGLTFAIDPPEYWQLSCSLRNLEDRTHIAECTGAKTQICSGVSLGIVADEGGVFEPQRLQERLPATVAARRPEQIYYLHDHTHDGGNRMSYCQTFVQGL